MTTYAPPLADIRFAMREVADLRAVRELPGYEEATDDLVNAVLEEAGRLGAEVLAPLNASGDRQGCVFENGPCACLMASSTPTGGSSRAAGTA
jgi:3-(methylsulfanyl)propanoyl-CoA dehydrogenase